jgi:hypothetical protein
MLAMVVAFAVAAATGALVAPSPAAAQSDPPWIIPPNGWCYQSWYTVTTNHGTQHVRHPDVPVMSFSNGTSTPATWSEQFSFSKTHTSTITTNTQFEGGIDLGIIRIGAQNSTQTVTVNSVTVTHTTGFSTTVLPFSTKFARYGTWRQVVTGNYVQSKHECVTWNYETVTSGQVTAHLVLADDPVGWYLWE